VARSRLGEKAIGSGGAPRRQRIVDLCPDAEIIVDVGADHGFVAQLVGAIATERLPHRIGQSPVPWVVADGLRPFRHVDVAIIAGMGARTIGRILDNGPRPKVVVVHAQDDPPALRRYLAANQWKIDAEALAPEAGRFAEIIRAVPGQEEVRGFKLDYGPVLLDSDEPYLPAHLAQLVGYIESLISKTKNTAPSVHQDLCKRLEFLHLQQKKLALDETGH
jgi:tRNA (adenine22-N1)-methyltransferase